MASVNGSQYVFSAAQTVNLVASPDGNQATLPAPVAGQFNLELIISPSGSTPCD
jgi:hypothetical protein